MYSNRPHPRLPRFGTLGGGLAGKPPRDLLVILILIFVTFSLQFFEATRILPRLLRLTPAVWQRGFLWQLVTYPFVGTGGANLWFLVSLLVLFWFGRDLYSQLGRRRFWKVILVGSLGAGLLAVAVNLAATLLAGAGPGPAPLALMQGQYMLMTIFIAGFATLVPEATIYLLFVLPVKAKWFLPLEIVFGFLGFLSTHDLAGFLGICAAVGITYAYLRPGGSGSLLHTWRLLLKRWWLQQQLARLRRRRGLRLVKPDPDEDKDSWVH